MGFVHYPTRVWIILKGVSNDLKNVSLSNSHKLGGTEFWYNILEIVSLFKLSIVKFLIPDKSLFVSTTNALLLDTVPLIIPFK